MMTLKLGRRRFVHLSLSAAMEHDRDTNEYKQFGSFSSQSYPNAVGLRSLAPPPQRYEGELRIADGYLMRVNKERCDRPRRGRGSRSKGTSTCPRMDGDIHARTPQTPPGKAMYVVDSILCSSSTSVRPPLVKRWQEQSTNPPPPSDFRDHICHI